MLNTENINVPDEFWKFIHSLFLYINERPEELKYCFKLEPGFVHYTIRVWSRRKEVDLHRSDEQFPEGDPRRYQSLFCISFYSIRRLLVNLKKFDSSIVMSELLDSKINAGKLKRYDCIMTPMENETFAKYEMITVKKKAAGNRYKINKRFNPFELTKEWLEVEEALLHPANAFVVHRVKGGRLVMNGQAFKFPGAHGNRSFLYLSPKLFRQWGKRTGELLNDALTPIQFGNKENIIKFLNKNLPALSNSKLISK